MKNYDLRLSFSPSFHYGQLFVVAGGRDGDSDVTLCRLKLAETEGLCVISGLAIPGTEHLAHNYTLVKHTDVIIL